MVVMQMSTKESSAPYLDGSDYSILHRITAQMFWILTNIIEYSCGKNTTVLPRKQNNREFLKLRISCEFCI